VVCSRWKSSAADTEPVSPIALSARDRSLSVTVTEGNIAEGGVIISCCTLWSCSS